MANTASLSQSPHHTGIYRISILSRWKATSVICAEVLESWSRCTTIGTWENCYEWYVVTSGDTCQGIESAYGLYFDLLRAWNPSIDNGCDNLQIGDAYCVDGTGKQRATTSTTVASSATSTTSTSTSSGVATPTPHSVCPNFPTFQPLLLWMKLTFMF